MGRESSDPAEPSDPSPHLRVHGVVLAAGRGERMGGPKHLLPLPLSGGAQGAEPPAEPGSQDPVSRAADLGPRSQSGAPEERASSHSLHARVPALAHVIGQLRAASVERVTAVLRPGDAEGERIALAAGAQVAFAWPAGEGRAASVRAAIRASAGAGAWLFALSDQPLLRGEDFERVLAAARSEPGCIVCASYAGQRGSPTLLPGTLREELLALRGEQGGRALVARYPERVRSVELDPRRGRDLDTAADVRALLGVDLRDARGTMPPTMTQRTLSIVKPDAVGAQSTGAILQAIEESGLRIVALRMLQLSPERAAEFYAVHKERPFYKSLCEFMISGPIVVSVLEGDDAIQRYRTLMGATDPSKAAEGTLRKRFATDVERNAVHGSDAPETAAQEIPFFFPELS